MSVHVVPLEVFITGKLVPLPVVSIFCQTTSVPILPVAETPVTVKLVALPTSPIALVAKTPVGLTILTSVLNVLQVQKDFLLHLLH